MSQGSRTNTKTKRTLASVLGLSVGMMGLPVAGGSLFGAGEVHAAPSEGEGPRVRLRVDVEGLGSGGESVGAKIEETAKGVIDGQGFGAATEELDPTIVVVVEKTGTEENPGFVVGFSIEKGEEIVPGSARQADCSLCTRTELIERIEDELPGLLKLAREHQVVAAGSDEGGGEEGGGEGGGEGGEDGGGDVKAIGPLGFAGIGLGVVGLAGVGVGVAFAVKGFEPNEPDYLERTNYRTPGNIVLSIGGAALIAGVVMIAVDVSKRKKQRSKGKGARIEAHGAGFAF